MKYSLFFIFLLNFNFHVWAQLIKEVKANRVIESNSVDSLIDEIISRTKNDKFFIEFSIVEVLDDYNFLVWGTKQNSSFINLGYNRSSTGKLIPKYDDNLRYFSYKGHLILIDGPDEPYQLFKPTSDVSILKFHNIDDGHTNLDIKDVSFFTEYKFLKGSFIADEAGYH